MRRLAVLAASLALVVTAACAPPAPAPPPEPPKITPDQMIAASKDIKSRFVAAFNARDAEAVSALYWNSPDTVLLPPDTMKVQGWEAIHSTFGAMFAAMPPGTLELNDTHEIVVADAVASWGLFKLTLTMPDGTTLVQDGRFSDVISMRDGKWVYLMDHASMPSPMEAPAGAIAPAAASAPAGG